MSSKLTMWILVAAVAGVLAGWAGHELSPDAAAAASLAGYFLDPVGRLPAPDQDDHRAAGVRNRGGGHRRGGRRQNGRAHRRQGDPVVRRPPRWSRWCSGCCFANLLGPGRDLALPLPEKDAATNLKTGGLNLREFITHVFPRSFFEAMATNEILQILVFSCFFGFALASLRERTARPR